MARGGRGGRFVTSAFTWALRAAFAGLCLALALYRRQLSSLLLEQSGVPLPTASVAREPSEPAPIAAPTSHDGRQDRSAGSSDVLPPAVISVVAPATSGQFFVPRRQTAAALDTVRRECGPHGEAFFLECLCALGWRGDTCTRPYPTTEFDMPPCRIRQEYSNSTKLSPYPGGPCCQVHPDYGRIRYINHIHWRNFVTKGEMDFWARVPKPSGNSQQVKLYSKFDFLPRDLGHVLEIGAGPYTKLRLLLETGHKVGRPFLVRSVAVQDPLVLNYTRQAKYCTYAQEKFCVNETGCISPFRMLSMKAEDLEDTKAFDTIILMNVMEHCEDAPLILSNVYYALKDGGILLFMENYKRDNAAGAGGQLCHFEYTHPLLFSRQFYDGYLSAFRSLHYIHVANTKAIYAAGKKDQQWLEQKIRARAASAT